MSLIWWPTISHDWKKKKTFCGLQLYATINSMLLNEFIVFLESIVLCVYPRNDIISLDNQRFAKVFSTLWNWHSPKCVLGLFSGDKFCITLSASNCWSGMAEIGFRFCKAGL